jgi:hypothetical protein
MGMNVLDCSGHLIIRKSSPYFSVNTASLGYKNQAIYAVTYREIIAVCSQIHTEHINTLCGQNVELLNAKLTVLILTTEL